MDMTNRQKEYLQKITDILNDFLLPFDCTTNIDTDFAYYSASNTITYALAFADSHAITFKNFINSIFPNSNTDIFLWSFLHELGHHETEDDFEDEEWKEYMEICNSITNDYEYYNLPIEYTATYWAGNYITNHKDEIENLWNKLIPAIKNFYKEMEININE